MKGELKPIGDRVLVELIETEETSSGGILLPGNREKRIETARVLAVGPGKYTTEGVHIPMQVKPDNVVLFERFAGPHLQEIQKDWFVIRESDLIAVVEV